MDTYDPQPSAPREYRGPFGAIPTAVPGIQLNELLVHHARTMDRASTIGIQPGYHSGAYLGSQYNPFDAGGRMIRGESAAGS